MGCKGQVAGMVRWSQNAGEVDLRCSHFLGQVGRRR